MNADQHSDQAITYMQQGQFELARKELHSALAIDPRHPVAHYNRAMLFKRQGNWQGVREALSTHLQIVPNDVEAHNNLGSAHHILGQLEDAIREWENALRIDPQHAGARLNLQNAKARLDDQMNPRLSRMAAPTPAKQKTARGMSNVASVIEILVWGIAAIALAFFGSLWILKNPRFLPIAIVLLFILLGLSRFVRLKGLFGRKKK